MAEHGIKLIPQGRPVLTHCNTGGLATAGLGTALAVIQLAAARGRIPEVLVDETRPLLQGGRLTLWELKRASIPARLLCDGAAAWALRSLNVGCVLVGADRVARNGDTANKVGTLGLALASEASGVPFYVVAPRSSFDPHIPDGGGIPVEERPAREVLRASGWRQIEEADAFNPAFDVTPAQAITAWITDVGVERPPFQF
jgi:methylthioribose-1-phosphate isomerase